MKATALLEKQHRVVKSIFKKLEAGKSDAQALLEELADNLAAHMAIEQEIFYPAVKAVKADLVAESYEEHSLAEIALKRLLGSRPGTDAFKARVVATKELIEHHVEEEEGDLFPAVEAKLDKETLEDLGARMKARFEEVLAEGFDRAVPKGTSRTSADVSRERVNGGSSGRTAASNRMH